MQDAVAFKTARGVQTLGRQDRLTIHQRTIRLKVQDPLWRENLAELVAPFSCDFGQLCHPCRIRARRAPDQDLAFGDQNVATFDIARSFDFAHIIINRTDRRGHFCHLAQTGRSTGAHQNRPLRQAQSGILDKDRIGIGLKRRQLDHFCAGAFQCSNIFGMRRQHLVQIRRADVFGPQPIDNARGGAPGNGTAELIGWICHLHVLDAHCPEGTNFGVVISIIAGPPAWATARNANATSSGMAGVALWAMP